MASLLVQMPVGVRPEIACTHHNCNNRPTSYVAPIMGGAMRSAIFSCDEHVDDLRAETMEYETVHGVVVMPLHDCDSFIALHFIEVSKLPVA